MPVLVVEVDEAVRNLLTIWLENSGYSVLTARGGQEALEVASGAVHQIILAVIDLTLPDMNVMELITALKRQQPGLKFLAISTYEDSGAIERCLKKPFSKEQLLTNVEELKS